METVVIMEMTTCWQALRIRYTPSCQPELINLLPWRARRRKARLRFWLSLLMAGSLGLCMLAGYTRHLTVQQNQHLTQQIRQQQSLNQTLSQRLSTAKAHYQQQQHLEQQLAQQQARQQQISAWHPLLWQLAQQLPADVWLSGIHYQHEQLRIEGYTLSIQALQSLSHTLNHLPGFVPVHTGETEFIDNKWRFGFLLARTSV